MALRRIAPVVVPLIPASSSIRAVVSVMLVLTRAGVMRAMRRRPTPVGRSRVALALRRHRSRRFVVKYRYYIIGVGCRIKVAATGRKVRPQIAVKAKLRRL